MWHHFRSDASMPRGQRLLQGTWIGDLIDLIPPPILAGIAVYRIAMTIPAPKWVDAKRKEFQRDMGQYRKVAFFHCCPTIFMLVVWLLVVYNYYAIVRWSDASWPVGVMVMGYGLIALQVASFDRVMRTHPGVLPEEWRVEAHRGHAPFYICRRTGRKLPPRCFHIKSLGQVPRVCAAQPTPPRSSPPRRIRVKDPPSAGALEPPSPVALSPPPFSPPLASPPPSLPAASDARRGGRVTRRTCSSWTTSASGSTSQSGCETESATIPPRHFSSPRRPPLPPLPPPPPPLAALQALSLHRTSRRHLRLHCAPSAARRVHDTPSGHVH